MNIYILNLKVGTRHTWSNNLLLNYKYNLFIFRERGREGKKQQCEREPQSGTEPAIQASPLTGNQTSDLLLCMTTSNQPSHISQSQPTSF